MSHIINYPLILRHTYRCTIARDTRVYQMQELRQDCNHICIMHDDNMYVYIVVKTYFARLILICSLMLWSASLVLAILRC